MKTKVIQHVPSPEKSNLTQDHDDYHDYSDNYHDEYCDDYHAPWSLNLKPYTPIPSLKAMFSLFLLMTLTPLIAKRKGPDRSSYLCCLIPAQSVTWWEEPFLLFFDAITGTVTLIIPKVILDVFCKMVNIFIGSFSMWDWQLLCYQLFSTAVMRNIYSYRVYQAKCHRSHINDKLHTMVHRLYARGH